MSDSIFGMIHYFLTLINDTLNDFDYKKNAKIPSEHNSSCTI